MVRYEKREKKDKIKNIEYEVPLYLFNREVSKLNEAFSELSFIDGSDAFKMLVNVIDDENPISDYYNQFKINSYCNFIIDEIIGVMGDKFKGTSSVETFLFDCFDIKDSFENGDLKNQFSFYCLNKKFFDELSCDLIIYGNILKYMDDFGIDLNDLDDNYLIEYTIVSANAHVVSFRCKNNHSKDYVLRSNPKLYDYTFLENDENKYETYESVIEFIKSVGLNCIKRPDKLDLNYVFEYLTDFPSLKYDDYFKPSYDFNKTEYDFKYAMSKFNSEVELFDNTDPHDEFIKSVQAEYNPWNQMEGGPSDYWDGYDLSNNSNNYPINNGGYSYDEDLFGEDPCAEFERYYTDDSKPLKSTEFIIFHLNGLRGKYGFLDYIVDYVKKYPEDYENPKLLLQFIKDFSIKSDLLKEDE